MARTDLTLHLAGFACKRTTAVVALLMSSVSFAADTGDAPASYGQASHAVVIGSPFLGNDEPDDNSPVAGITALDDDNDGLDDEGGVFAFPVLVQNGKSYDTNVFASNPLDTDATLVGWVDFDGDGRFDADEAATATVPAGTNNEKFKLQWPDLTNISSSFAGTTYARFRISTDALTEQSMQGPASDGEVEDYSLEILLDSDGDERPDITDPDNDNDGIPDIVEGVTVDSDGDQTPDYLDVDSDSDFIPDYVEAGSNPLVPADTDNDGIPDYLDQDSDDDGIPDSEEASGDADRDTIPDSIEADADTDRDGVLDRNDLDSDNDTIPDVIEVGDTPTSPVDSDGDGVPDYQDLDSDNDGIADIREANSGEFDVNTVDADNDGRVDSQQLTGANGYVDLAETAVDSGVPVFAIADTDGDGNRDFREIDSDGDGVADILEAGGTDTDSNGVLDNSVDIDQDGMVDGENLVVSADSLPDTDDDNIPDFQDDNADGSRTGPGQGDDPTPPVTPVEPPDSSPGQNVGLIETGLSGGAGCAVGPVGSARTDAVLWLLLVVSLFARLARKACARRLFS